MTQDGRIGCTVDTCRYYAAGDRCEADQILVNRDSPEEHGSARMETGALGGSRVRTSSETRCDTFRPR